MTPYEQTLTCFYSFCIYLPREFEKLHSNMSTLSSLVTQFEPHTTFAFGTRLADGLFFWDNCLLSCQATGKLPYSVLYCSIN